MTGGVADAADPIALFQRRHLGDLETRGDGCGDLQRQVSDWMRSHDVVFAGDVIPFVMAPHCLDVATMVRVRHAVEVLTRVLDRFCASYRTDEPLQRALDLPPAERDLISIEPTLDDPLQLCRLDAFLMPDGAISFLEFNAESPAGIGYTDVMFDGLVEHLPALRDPHLQVTYERITDHLIRTIWEVEGRWRSWASGVGVPGVPAATPKRPRALLVDTAQSPSVPEFRIICAALDKAGFDADHASFEELEWTGERLCAKGHQVDVVYRRALLEDILDPTASPGAAALLIAIRAGAVAVLNPFPARVANNKKLLALIGAPEFAHLLQDDEEREVVRTSIPWTRVLAPGGTLLPDGHAGDLRTYVAANRERLVLKPASDYGGHNVHLGINTSQRHWHALVHAHAGTGDWIVQEYLDVPRGEFPAIEDGRMVLRSRHFNINPFAIGGHYAGMITRVSDQAVINVSAGGGLLPCVAIDLA